MVMDSQYDNLKKKLCFEDFPYIYMCILFGSTRN